MALKFENKNVKILIIGDLMLDSYLFTKCERISPEAPVPVVLVEKEIHSLGGAGNVLKNVFSFGADVNIISCIGVDESGNQILDSIKDFGISTSNIITDHTRTTTKKTRIIASNQQMIRIDRETVDVIGNIIEIKLIEAFRQLISDTNIVLISDYQKGVLTNNVLTNIIRIANQYKKSTIVDPKGVDFTKYLGATLIKPNKSESEIASGFKIKNNNDIKDVLSFIKSKTNASHVILTLSENGIAIYNNKLKIIPTQARDVYDVTGAGDTVLASLGFCLAHGNTIIDSCHFANHAAAIVINKLGTAVTTVAEVMEHIKYYARN